MGNKRGILQDAQRRKTAKNSSDPHQLTSNNIIFTYIYILTFYLTYVLAFYMTSWHFICHTLVNSRWREPDLQQVVVTKSCFF